MIVEKRRYWLPNTPPVADYKIVAVDNETDRIVLTNGKDNYDLDLSKKNFNILIDKFGKDNSKWVNKDIQILTEFDVVKNQNARTII